MIFITIYEIYFSGWLQTTYANYIVIHKEDAIVYLWIRVMSNSHDWHMYIWYNTHTYYSHMYAWRNFIAYTHVDDFVYAYIYTYILTVQLSVIILPEDLQTFYKILYVWNIF